ncbi:ATPase, T2SS/T4P/T4SS family [Desulfococcaceae bacterium HSG8]|nr:ATPase, T2SS/T4P/T4SS family [Desulfococcaceae bacterium HSG8]
MDIQPNQTFIGSYLLKKGLITPEDLQKAVSFQNRIRGKLGPILIRIGAISEDNFLKILSELSDMRLIDAQELPADPRIFYHTIEQSGIDPDWWLDQEALVWESPEGLICCMARDPLDDSLGELLKRVFPDQETVFFLVRSYDLERALDAVARIGSGASQADNDIDQLRELAEEAPVIEFVNNLLAQAHDQRASDVHIEPGEHILEVRFRIDGILFTRFSLPGERFAAISSRIKLISGMDIAERRLPQDGRIGLRLSGESVDVRVSAAPGVHGESVVLRLLPKEGGKFSIRNLGLEADNYHIFSQWINEPHGIILVTGPTGSGKSTTLYAALEAVNDKKKKIITVEDPVEYHLEGITQIQTHSEIGYTFARALRSILRQDPDVIMIGEIRDKETAEIAVQASLTGHLVISTLHTNDAVSAFTRLIDMGIDPFLVATPVRAVMAQRLIRRICPTCAEPAEPIPDIQKMVQAVITGQCQEKPRWRGPVGCAECQGTGYKGREGIYELVPVTSEIQHHILNGRTGGDIRRLTRKQNCRTLREDGLLKAWRGITSVEEVLRVTAE